MKNLKKIIIVLVIFVLVFLVVYMFLCKPNLKPIKAQMTNLNLNNYDKLMIVSHPGDESVWGGVHLLSDNYLVVCVSCGYDKNKEEKFLETTKFSNDSVIMLGYSDKVYFNYKKIKNN